MKKANLRKIGNGLGRTSVKDIIDPYVSCRPFEFYSINRGRRGYTGLERNDSGDMQCLIKKRLSAATEAAVADLRAGDEVLISGVVYAARDQAHKRLCTVERRAAPVTWRGHHLFVGPTPGGEGRPIGSAGPTTSSRMDAFTSNCCGGIRRQSARATAREVQRRWCGIRRCTAAWGYGALLAEHTRLARWWRMRTWGGGDPAYWVLGFPRMCIRLYGESVYRLV